MTTAGGPSPRRRARAWAVVAAAALCAFNATLGGSGSWADGRIFFSRAHRRGTRAARSAIAAGRPRLLDASAVGRERRQLYPEGPSATSLVRRLGLFDPATRLPVHERTHEVFPTLRLDFGPDFAWMHAVYECAYNAEMRTALQAGELDAHLGPERPPTRADLSTTFENGRTMGGPRTGGEAELPGGRFILHRRHSKSYGDWRYYVEDTDFGDEVMGLEFVPGSSVVLPLENRARFVLDDDGVTLYSHEIDSDTYWCFHLHQRSIIAKAPPPGER